MIDAGRRHGIKRLIPGMLIYCTGLVNISIVLIMIILYQNFEGVVYYKISLINALFMLGLAAGSYVVNNFKRVRTSTVFFLLFLSLSLVYFYAVFKMAFLFWVMLALFSSICGGGCSPYFSVLIRAQTIMKKHLCSTQWTMAAPLQARL